MAKKCLILYASKSGNTEKVALVFKNTFERNGWKCDIYKIEENTDVTEIPEYNEYDFMCVGSPVHLSLPLPEVIKALRKTSKKDSKGETALSHGKIVLGPDSKKGIVFVTFTGAHFGPKEAEPALALMDLEMEHQKFQCIGRFCCPGDTTLKDIRATTDKWYYGDMRSRPNERDLKRAEIFIEDKLEEIAER